jgi:hypothetical protein
MDRRHQRARVGVAAMVTLVSLAAAACAGDPGPTIVDNMPPGGVVTGPDLRRAAALQPFDSCPDVLRWFQDEAVARLGPYGDGLFPANELGMAEDAVGVAPMAGSRSSANESSSATGSATAPAAPAAGGTAGTDFSTTNVQEAGVDEPDIVKTDGRHLLSMAGQDLRVVDLTGPSPALAGRVTVPGEGDTRLLLHGDRALALTEQSRFRIEPAIAGRATPPGFLPQPPEPPGTRLTLIDLSRPATPTVLSSVVVDGDLVDARMIDGRARVVTSSTPDRLPLVHPSRYTDEAIAVARRTNEDVIRRSTLADWLPRVRPGAAKATDPGDQLVPCAALRHPAQQSGLDTLAVLSFAIGPDNLDLSDTVGLTAGGDLVYASDRTLYVGTTVAPPVTLPVAPPISGGASSVPPFVKAAPATTTAIHAFAISGDGPAVYRGSGTVDGEVNDRWSMSEHDGHLRVVSTTGTFGCRGCAGRQSQVSVLAEHDGGLDVVGTAGDMGRGEMVKSVRFVGTRGYVVTFRQTDPLYVLDVADPAHPRVTGELKVPGFSAYLHPVGDGLLLGVGQDATDRGRVLGTKVALYDVSDPARPREVDHQVLPATTSEVEQDSRAFLWWAPTRLAVVPVLTTAIEDARQTVTVPAAAGFRVGDATVREVGRIAVPGSATGQLRSVVVGDAVLTVAPGGVRVSALDTLADRGWLAL